jgi:hypothetical protein
MTKTARMLRHHETMNLAGWAITIAPVITLTAQAAVKRLRKKKERKQTP